MTGLKRWFLFFSATLFSLGVNAQFLVASDTLSKPRVLSMATIGGAGYVAIMIGLNELWYKDYPRSDFHFFDDNRHWLQMDKAGHAVTSYQVGRYGYESLRWAGVSEPNALWVGGSVGLFFLTSVEFLDGYSDEWGFSPGDAGANVFGAGLFIGQQIAWGEQRISLKFSYSQSPYAALRPEVLGSSGLDRLLKDYNGQTIWLSVNPASFMNREKPILPWLNLALGYGADGMLAGERSMQDGLDIADIRNIKPYRQYYLSLDVDLNKIKTQNHLLKTIFSVVGFLKVPAPTIEFSESEFKWHWLYF